MSPTHRRVLMLIAQYPGINTSRIAKIYTARCALVDASRNWMDGVVAANRDRGFVITKKVQGQKANGHFITSKGLREMKKACEIELSFFAKEWLV